MEKGIKPSVLFVLKCYVEIVELGTNLYSTEGKFNKTLVTL